MKIAIRVKWADKFWLITADSQEIIPFELPTGPAPDGVPDDLAEVMLSTDDEVARFTIMPPHAVLHRDIMRFRKPAEK